MSSDSTSGSPPPGDVDGPLRPSRCNALLLSFLSFWLIVFGVWVVSAGKRYREEYAQGQGTEGWSVGSTQISRADAGAGGQAQPRVCF